jgi:hypothetical protein
MASGSTSHSTADQLCTVHYHHIADPWANHQKTCSTESERSTIRLTPQQEKQALQEFRAIRDPIVACKQQLSSCALTVEQFALYYYNIKLQKCNLRSSSSSSSSAAKSSSKL